MGEWVKATLGEVTSYMAKGIPPKYVELENENTVKVLNQKCNRDFRVSYAASRLHNTLAKKIPADKMLQPGDVLINSTGAGTAGRVAQIWDIPSATTVDGHMIILRPTDEMDLLYYGYAIKSYQSAIEAYAEGSTGQTEINKIRLKNETIIHFPTNKQLQHRIGRLLADLDEKIIENEKINRNLEEQAQVIYINMFSNKALAGVELSTIIDVRDGTHDSPKSQADGYPLITSKHLQPFGVDKVSANSISQSDFDKINARSRVETHDVLMSMIGTIGLISYVAYETVDFAIKNVALFKTSQSPELAYYFLCYLKSNETQQCIEKHLAGSTQKYISLGELRKMPIYSPSNAEIQIFNSLVEPLLDGVVLRTRENTRLAELRDSLLPKIMSGELDVSNLDL